MQESYTFYINHHAVSQHLIASVHASSCYPLVVKSPSILFGNGFVKYLGILAGKMVDSFFLQAVILRPNIHFVIILHVRHG